MTLQVLYQESMRAMDSCTCWHTPTLYKRSYIEIEIQKERERERRKVHISTYIMYLYMQLWKYKLLQYTTSS